MWNKTRDEYESAGVGTAGFICVEVISGNYDTETRVPVCPDCRTPYPEIMCTKCQVYVCGPCLGVRGVDAGGEAVPADQLGLHDCCSTG